MATTNVIRFTEDYVSQNFEAYGKDNSVVSSATVIFYKDISAIQCKGKTYPLLIGLAAALAVFGLYLGDVGIMIVCFVIAGILALLYFIIRPHTITITAHSGTSIVQGCNAKEARIVMKDLIKMKQSVLGNSSENLSSTAEG